jgi:hypothetical protein
LGVFVRMEGDLALKAGPEGLACPLGGGGGLKPK